MIPEYSNSEHFKGYANVYDAARLRFPNLLLV